MGLHSDLSILEAFTLFPPCAGYSGWSAYDLSFLAPAAPYRRLSCGVCRMRAAGKRQPVPDHQLLRLGTCCSPTSAAGLRLPVLGAIPSGKRSAAAGPGLLFLRLGSVGQVAVRMDA